jgi:hypothetical protein
MNILDYLTANHCPGSNYQGPAELPAHLRSPVRLIAYYLPQYHPIPENDTWWGQGFTEWTNVSKALPRFQGHYQPHLPGELGFYDLRNPEVLQRQAELVRAYGLSGLCFHHYWFNGKPLLDMPIRLLLDRKDIDLPFCVNWANENWSRRWDGNDSEILIGQSHSPSDDIAFAASLEPLFRDPRYIRVGRRPLLMVYRPKLLPNAAATVRRWRAHFQAAGLDDPYIVMAQAHGDADPRPYGMNAAAGFPPHQCGFDAPPIQDTLGSIDESNRGTVVRYADMVAAALANQPNSFRLFPGVCPSWDNEARKPGRGFSVHGATPADYHDWLLAACERALTFPDADERIVFINAWNEWAEGAHLEPDRHLGYAYLAQTARVVARICGLDAAELRSSAPPPEPPDISRPLRTLPGLVVRNLAFHAANTAEAIARSLRMLV